MKSDIKTKRQASKEARRESKEIEHIAEEYDLDPMGDFLEYLEQKYGR